MEITGRPERKDRTNPVVEELWSSPSHRYAVEHTRLESYGGQIGNEVKLRELMLPIRASLIGRLQGSYVLAVRLSETGAAHIKYSEAHKKIIELTLEIAQELKDGETVVLPSTKLPFTVQLSRRHGNASHVAVHSLMDGDGEDLRLQRMRRALEDKCPKLASWAGDSRRSVLVLEANDIQLSNAQLAFEAFKQALAERTDQPDTVIFVETDGEPMYGWMFKEGEYMGDTIPMPSWERRYVEGQVR